MISSILLTRNKRRNERLSKDGQESESHPLRAKVAGLLHPAASLKVPRVCAVLGSQRDLGPGIICVLVDMVP